MSATTGQLLSDLDGKYSKIYADAIHEMFVAVVTSDKVLARKAKMSLGSVMAETMGYGEVIGATMMLKEAAKFKGGNQKAVEMQPFSAKGNKKIFHVSLAQAIDDMVSRAPVTIQRAADRTAKTIAMMYGKNHMVAFVRSAESYVTKAAKDFIVKSLKDGIGEGQAGRKLSMAVNEIRKKSRDWSEGYARMVFRTNIGSAITAGRFRQAMDPDISEVVPAFRFDAVNDSDCRENHRAADGIILSVHNPAWAKLAPPLGYNCRCQVSHVSLIELQALGRVKKGAVVESRISFLAGPDTGFRHGGRPDLELKVMTKTKKL